MLRCGPGETLSLDQVSVPKLSVVVHTCAPSTWEVEEGRAQIQGQPGLNSELEDSIGYRRDFFFLMKKRKK